MSEDIKSIKIKKPSKGDHKKTVDTKPTLHEARDQSRVDGLIHAGLGESVDLTKFRHALTDPKGAVNSVQYRDAVGRVLDCILEVIFSDPSLYNKIKNELQQKHIHEGFVGDVLKGVASEISKDLLHKHLGVIGKAITMRAAKKKKKKP